MVEERKLNREEKEELAEARAGFDLDEDQLGEVLDEASLEPDDELLFRLGVWYGDQVADITGWVWVHLTLGPGLESPALVSADRGLAFLPLQVVVAEVETKRDPWDPAPRALVTMLERLAGGARPKGEPGSYALVTP